MAQAVVHETVACDGCGMAPLVGARFKCSPVCLRQQGGPADSQKRGADAGCLDFDLCEGCARGGPGQAHVRELGHTLVRIERPAPRSAERERDTLRGTVDASLAAGGPLPCLGERARLEGAARGPRFEWLSFDEVRRHRASVGRALLALAGGRRGAHVALMAPNCVEWVLADLGCVEEGLVSVTVHHSSFGTAATDHIFRTAAPVACVCDEVGLERLAGARGRGAAEALAAAVLVRLRPGLHPGAEPAAARLRELGVRVTEFSELTAEEAGRRAGAHARPERPEWDADAARVVSVVHTSGSSGLPKGTLMRGSVMNDDMRRVLGTHFLYGPQPVRLLVHPLSWMTGRDDVLYNLAAGGPTAVFSRPPAELLEEMEAVAPTTIRSTPAFFERVERLYRQVERAVAQAHSELDADAVERRAIDRFVELAPLGGRVKHMAVGGAHVPPAVLSFMRAFAARAGARVFAGYGTTECGGIASEGVAFSTVEVRIDPVPEMGLAGGAGDATPRALAHVPQRGEIVVRSPSVAAGYLGGVEAASHKFEDGGWFRTGDAGEFVPDGRRLRVIGRIGGALFKLPSGCFVSVAEVEAALATCPDVRSILVHGTPRHPALVAVVAVEAAAAESGQPAAAELLDALARRAAGAGLPPSHVPRDVHAVTEPFTVANGLLTPSSKLCRRSAVRRYAAELKAMLDGLAAREAADDALPARPAAVAENSPVAATLAEHGLTSVSGMRLAGRIRRELGVDVPVGALLAGGTTGDDLQAAVKAAAAAGGADRASMASDMAGDCEALLAGLVKENDVGMADARSSRVAEAAEDVVAVTGVTGFVGAFVLDRMLRDRTASRFIVLARAASDAEAAARVRGAAETYGLGWPHDEASAARVRALAADLSLERMGLDEETFARLGAAVTGVVHAAATTNWVLGYTALRGSNVLATREAVRLAAAGPAGGWLLHVSTVSARDGAAAGASGYARTKLVAERLVQAARRRWPARLRATGVVRVGMVGPASGTGRCRSDDFYGRLVRSVRALGAFPDSQGHFVAVPVDALARRLAALAGERAADSRVVARRDACPTFAELGRAAAAGTRARAVPPAEFARMVAAADAPLAALQSFIERPQTWAGTDDGGGDAKGTTAADVAASGAWLAEQ